MTGANRDLLANLVDRVSVGIDLMTWHVKSFYRDTKLPGVLERTPEERFCYLLGSDVVEDDGGVIPAQFQNRSL